MGLKQVRAEGKKKLLVQTYRFQSEGDSDRTEGRTSIFLHPFSPGTTQAASLDWRQGCSTERNWGPLGMSRAIPETSRLTQCPQSAATTRVTEAQQGMCVSVPDPQGSVQQQPGTQASAE